MTGSQHFSPTPGQIGLKFDIFELMFYEILVMHIQNSNLVYNFYEQAIKLFLLSFTCFMWFLILLFLYRNNDRKLIGVLFSFVNRSCLDFPHTRKTNFTYTGVICLILCYLLSTFADFEITAGFSKSDMFNWLLKKFENHQKQGKKLSEAWRMNLKTGILPLLVTRKISRSSQTNTTSLNWIH